MNRKYSISRHTLARSLPMKMKLWRIFTVALLPVVAAAPESSSTLELQTGWRPASSWVVVQDGSQISQPSYHPSRWYPIRTIPATVLQILEEDGAYGNGCAGSDLDQREIGDLVGTPISTSARI